MKLFSQAKEAGNAVLAIILALLVVAALVFVGLGIKHRRALKKSAAVSPASSVQATTSSDSKDYSSDLSSLTTSLNQSNQSLQASNTAVNDQQQQVTVPTN